MKISFKFLTSWLGNSKFAMELKEMVIDLIQTCLIMPYIDVINYNEAQGKLKETYDHLIETRGKLAELHKIQSLHPETIIHHMNLYMSIMFGKSPLKRYQREMIAVVVSAANRCEYCHVHHGAALNHFWKDEDKVELLKQDHTKVELSEVDQLLCEYAEALTLAPETINQEDHIESLKLAGLSDKAILDAALIVSYFNFSNRLVLGLGVELEEDKGEGYKYD